MDTKKYFVMIAVAVCLSSTLWGQEQKDPNEDVQFLQEKVKQLERVIESQQKKILKQRPHMMTLKNSWRSKSRKMKSQRLYIQKMK